MNKISIALATYNEEKNIGECLKSVQGFADEIVIVDGSSTDKTVEIAKTFNARVVTTDNPVMFHINKQKAIDICKNEWILQMDADERVSKALAEEIKEVISMTDEELVKYQEKIPNRKLFLRHQRLIEERDGRLGEHEGAYNAFFIPRLNFFLGKYLRYGGVYPDGVIRLIRKNKACLPCKSVHEQMVVKGKVGWLHNDLLHMADPTFKRYLQRNSRYINEMVEDELKVKKTPKNLTQFINYLFIKPLSWFILTQVRHKGILDGYQGVVFSFFSALRFPRGYWRYILNK